MGIGQLSNGPPLAAHMLLKARRSWNHWPLLCISSIAMGTLQTIAASSINSAVCELRMQDLQKGQCQLPSTTFEDIRSRVLARFHLFRQWGPVVNRLRVNIQFTHTVTPDYFLMHDGAKAGVVEKELCAQMHSLSCATTMSTRLGMHRCKAWDAQHEFTSCC